MDYLYRAADWMGNLMGRSDFFESVFHHNAYGFSRCSDMRDKIKQTRFNTSKNLINKHKEINICRTVPLRELDNARELVYYLLYKDIPNNISRDMAFQLDNISLNTFGQRRINPFHEQYVSVTSHYVVACTWRQCIHISTDVLTEKTHRDLMLHPQAIMHQ